MRHHVFLSYSRHDSDIMHRVRDDLRAAEVLVWTDESLTPGTESWKDAIEDAIQNAGSVVVLLSPDSKHSSWVERELDYARACHVPVIPVLVRGEDEISAIPFELISTQRVDLRADHEGGMPDLIRAVQSSASLIAADSDTVYTPGAHFTASSQQAFQLGELNPYHHLKLLLALLTSPGRITRYAERNDETRIRKLSAWIAAWLGWLPFILATSGFMLKTVTIPGASENTNGLVILSLALFGLGLIVTGRFGWLKDTRSAIVLLVITTILLLLVLVPTYGTTGINFAHGGGVTPIAFLVTAAVTLGAAIGIALVLANAATGALGGMVLSAMIFILIFDEQYGVNGGLAVLVAVIMMLLTAKAVDQTVNEGQKSPLGMFVLAVLAVNYSVMLWMYWLGGWQVLAGLQ